jgi:hypothetical protein
MKKTVFQIVVVVTLLLMGCSKDELINDTSENNQLKTGRLNTSTEIFFLSNSIANDDFIVLAPGYLCTDRKILRTGIFTGTINGIGKINSRKSTYEIKTFEILDHDGFWYFSDPSLLTYSREENMYKITVEGNIIINEQDHCSITITGNIYPVCYYPLDSSEFGSFEGTAVINSGTRNLADLNGKKFRVYGRPFNGATFFNGNHNTGDFHLKITDNLEINN